MNLLRALHYRQKSLRRRLGPRLAVAPLVILLSVGVLIAGLFALGGQLADGPAPDADAISNTAFWFAILQALIYCYTTFEVLFRAPDARFLSALPIHGARRFDELATIAYAVHLPLLLPPVAYGLALWDRGLPELAGFAMAYPALSFIFGLPLALALHLVAGRSLLAESSQLKKMLAGNVVADEAALLIYAPALGLLVIAVSGIFLELTLRKAFVAGDLETLAMLAGGVLLAAALAWRAGRRIARDSLHRILPRFAEADVPPPFLDDGVARHLPGAAFGRLLPAAARPYFLRDLRQLRRRFRLDRVLLWLSPLVVWKIAADADAGAALGASVMAYAFLVALVFTSGFRLVGRELAAPALDQALPMRPGPARLGRLAASALHPAQLACSAALGAALGGGALVGLATLGLCLGLGLLWVLAVFLVTRAIERDHVGAWALAMRLGALAAVAWTGGLM